MAFDVNGNYQGNLFGKDRLGFVTPDCDASEDLQPFLPISYPAPYLPIRRRDEGHPVAAGVVLSTGYLVGTDKSGGLVPAGMRSGTTPAGIYSILQYGADDVGFAWNPQTCTTVVSPTEYCLIGAPAAAAPNDNVNGVLITAGDITFAHSCDLIPGGVARPLGYSIKNCWSYLGGVQVVSQTGGMLYVMDSMNPTGFAVHNYMHEMGTAIRTRFVLRVPWIGANPTAIQTLAAADGITGYLQNDWSRSFSHFTGAHVNTPGGFFPGCSVVASDQFNFLEAGHFAPFDPAKHAADQICGRVLGVEKLNPITDFKDRVRTQFDRAGTLVGPFRESHPVQMQMGGSATRGLDYQANLSGNGIFRIAKDNGKPLHDEYGTYVYVKVQC